MKLVTGILTIILATSAYAENQIRVSGTVEAYANTQHKSTVVNGDSLQQDLFLETNKQGLTIALTDDSFGSSIFLNHRLMGSRPIDFSDNIYSKPTKVGELTVSKRQNLETVCVVIAVK